ncbi:MAG: glycosyltransferase family 4 protein [Candidatus Yanofskybacteria bacterium]|nr:glycosyltransferase family 4 protein [Candidatus Yanofskybacteria bacterium]
MNNKKIIITGHPYAFPYYFEVFEYAENRGDLIFVLPKLWVAKKGKVKTRLESRNGFTQYGLGAASFGGRGVAGLFKGWLPGLIFLLPYLRLKHGSKVLYSCSEPNLLTTLCNGLLAKFCGMKYVFFTWQNVPPERYMSGPKLIIYTALVRFNLRLADGVICGNRKAERIILKLKPKRHHFKTIICPVSGVDTQRFRPGIKSDWRIKLGIGGGEKSILFYGALDKRKGVDILIEAMKILIANHQTLNTKLIIVGTGPEQENLKLQTTNYKLQTRVTFLDWMSNNQLPALLNAADIFVYPSVPSGGWEEQFGYAMAEASACGVPVVATRTGSIDEVVVDGRGGFLIEPNDPGQLAEATSKILSNDDLRKRMGEFGRRHVVESFGHKLVVLKIESFLRGMGAS